MPDRGLGLDGHELDEVVDRVERLGRVLDLPDDHGGDLDRVAVGVVYLRERRLQVPDPGRDRYAVGKRVHPLQALVADRALVPAEELNDVRPARRDGGEAAEHEDRGNDEDDARPHQAGPAAIRMVAGLPERDDRGG
jgi:hypothetical protein